MKDNFENLKGEALTIVNSTNTAIAAGSGSLSVFGTPFMIGLMEKATCNACIDLLEENETTVGISIDVTHDKASGLGTTIVAHATLVDVQGRKLVFDVDAVDDKGEIVGKGTICRFVVLVDKFMKRVEAK